MTKFYQGKLCIRHLELQGARYAVSQQCPRCVKEYNQKPDSKTNRARYKRTPAAKAAQARYDKTPKRAGIRRRHNWVCSGMNPDEAQERLSAHGGRCDACGTAAPAARRPWHVDHDHRTGRVRGILCFHCNAAVGFVKDSPEIARKVAAYLDAGK